MRPGTCILHYTRSVFAGYRQSLKQFNSKNNHSLIRCLFSVPSHGGDCLEVLGSQDHAPEVLLHPQGPAGVEPR